MLTEYLVVGDIDPHIQGIYKLCIGCYISLGDLLRIHSCTEMNKSHKSIVTQIPLPSGRRGAQRAGW